MRGIGLFMLFWGLTQMTLLILGELAQIIADAILAKRQGMTYFEYVKFTEEMDHEIELNQITE